MAEANTLKILLTKDGSNPFSENASGDILGVFNKAVLGQLLTVKDNFELQPNLLRSWKWNSNDNSYELFLREDLHFHDGSPIKSEDLEFTLLRGFFSRQTSFYEIYLGNILGAQSIKPGTKFTSGIVKGVQITGTYSLKIFLKSPNPSFLYSLATPFFSFVKRSELNDDLLTWKKWPMGAGPYRVTSISEDKIILEKTANSKLPNDAPLTIELYKKELPNIQYDISYYENKHTTGVYTSKDASAIYTLFFTNQNEISKNKDFREAVAYGLDRDFLIKDDKYSRPSYSFLTSAQWKDSNNKKEYDFEKAKYHFSKIPESLRNKTWPVAFYSFGDLSSDKKIISKRLTEQFAKFGLKITVIGTTEKFLSKETATECSMRYSGRVSDNVDPLLMFASFKTNSAYKYDNAQNDSAFDKLYEDASHAVGTDERISTLKKLSKYTIDNNFMVPLFENLEVLYYNKDTISSFGDQPSALVLALDQIRKK